MDCGRVEEVSMLWSNIYTFHVLCSSTFINNFGFLSGFSILSYSKQ
jgi:hypothetical protein